ncbi:MAG TPA: HipA family kinase, partial [Puia sp.]|nr:HipA family kinase [Puia sp.]
VFTAVSEQLASEIIWFDAFVANVDRTVRNTNLLSWFKELWLIDHGASLYYHHHWENFMEKATDPFAQIRDHVLLGGANRLDEADRKFREKLNNEVVASIVSLIPDEWLVDDEAGETPAQKRKAYRHFLETRLEASANFVNEAKHARKTFV